MIPITWPEFSDMHPFAPLTQASGYVQMIEELHSFLCRLTGFVAASTQPNVRRQCL
jgi:glycine dehydrogenase